MGPPRVHVDDRRRRLRPRRGAGLPGCRAGRIERLGTAAAARCAGRDRRVVGIDFAEVDAAADATDERTVRLVALGVLEAAAGLATRPASTLAT